jgi:hypothetical protein
MYMSSQSDRTSEQRRTPQGKKKVATGVSRRSTLRKPRCGGPLRSRSSPSPSKMVSNANTEDTDDALKSPEPRRRPLRSPKPSATSVRRGLLRGCLVRDKLSGLTDAALIIGEACVRDRWP